jgi:RNA polymerase sigma-70 factor (ECF subfamily)
LTVKRPALFADFETLYEKYFPMVLRRCRDMLKNEDDAFDTAQNVFERALEARSRMAGRIEYPSSFLYTIATRLCLNRIRKEKRRADRTAPEGFNEDSFPCRDPGFDETEAQVMVEGILKSESEDTRALLYMYYADGMTLEETGKVIGLSTSGVRKRIMTFKKRANLHEGGRDGKFFRIDP